MRRERIWSIMGMEHDASIIVDSAGTPFTADGLDHMLRDMVRFGEMMRMDGRFNGKQIVPAAMVAKS